MHWDKAHNICPSTLHICIDQKTRHGTFVYTRMTKSISRVALGNTTSVWHNDRITVVIVFTFKSLFLQVKYITLKKDTWLVKAVSGQLVIAQYRYIRGNVNVFVFKVSSEL